MKKKIIHLIYINHKIYSPVKSIIQRDIKMIYYRRNKGNYLSGNTKKDYLHQKSK